MATGAVLLKGRNARPSNYLFKIESFSLLSKSSVEEFCSDDFEAGDYKWQLHVYPTGDKSRNVKDNISIYLELVDTESLPTGWEVNVISNFFIFNHLQNKYFSNADVVQTRYHSMKTIFGIDNFINLSTFSYHGNGYLFNDTCVFGVEVFFVINTFKEQCLSMMPEPIAYYHTCKVTNFSCIGDGKYVIIWLYPKGRVDGKGNSISIFLDVSCSSIPQGTKLFVNNFLSLAELKDTEEGYLVDDTLIIEAEATLLGLVLTES
ncbi:hypothetical protein ACOSP7_020314 [Xanthoceras sorbifolium]